MSRWGALPDKISELWDVDRLSLFGRRLGSGGSRTVYVCAIDDRFVVKFGHAGGYDNFMERCFWQAAQGYQWKDWLAPVVWLSHDGRALVQARTFPLRGPFPTTVPGLIFHDGYRTEQWGMLNGHPVMHDYGGHVMRYARLGVNHALASGMTEMPSSGVRRSTPRRPPACQHGDA